ncbi:MAG: hypothetical protein LBQ84_01455 [Flavobacteriaceae bacterium]|jgi:plasmid stabilization system protein ParE|nr:hypothetical protein [Flavobacteriaceae bacterium]
MKIIWSYTAHRTFKENLLYLKKEWDNRTIITFINKVDLEVKKLSENPYLGSVLDDKYRKLLIVKQIYAIYRITDKQEIFILTFWNNYQNPERLTKLLS